MQHRFFLSFPGITRLPVLEGEVSHVEIPRTNQNLGITIVGGADTPLVRHAVIIADHCVSFPRKPPRRKREKLQGFPREQEKR